MTSDPNMVLKLGERRSLDGKKALGSFELASAHLLTHGVIVGMTGSGKTGLLTVVVEEALRQGIPALVFDVKGDLPNLALAFPSFDPGLIAPWVEPAPGDADGVADPPLVEEANAARKRGLAEGGIGESELASFAAGVHVRVITPGAQSGEPLHLLSALERRSARWDSDAAGARAALSGAISLVLRLVGREGDPGRSKDHALLSVLAEERLARGEDASLERLVVDVMEPKVASIGALAVDDFLPPKARRELAADLNTWLATPTFAAWRAGQSLDVEAWMAPVAGRTPATIVSVAHLDDDERMLVLGVVLDEVMAWVRRQPGSGRLRALVAIDEVHGLVPPHPASPPSKRR